RTDNLGSDVVAIDGLNIGLNITDCPIVVFQIDHTGHHITVLRDFGADSYRCIGMDLGDFIAHEPTRQVEIMNRIVIEEHSIHVGLVGGKRWSILVTTDRLEDDGLTYRTGRNPLHRSCIRRVVAAHETNLQTNTCLSHSLERKMGISKIHRQGLFAKNVLSRSSSNTDCLCMKFVGSSYQDTIDVFALNHILKGGK